MNINILQRTINHENILFTSKAESIITYCSS